MKGAGGCRRTVRGSSGRPRELQRKRCRMAKRSGGPVRYAVVGLGHIAQVAMLPAFAHARRNSRLAALVSDDGTKLKSLSRKYKIRGTFSYADYDACLEQVDA